MYTTSDCEDFLFFCSQHVIDLSDTGIGCLLNLARKPIVIVLADLVILLELLDNIHGVTPDMAYRNPRGLSIFVRNLDQFFTPLFVKFWNAQTNCLPFGCRRQAEIRIYDGFFDGMDQ